MKGLLPYTLQVNGRLLDLSEPQVMGILNVTPDSFYAGSRKQDEAEIARRVEQILAEGGDMIDIGAYSSRPNAEDVPPSEEAKRLRKGLRIIRSIAPEAVVSVDTFRADIAAMCVEEYGVAIVNDISGGDLDPRMFETVAGRLRVPYILMHIKGTPQNMQVAPVYDDLMTEVTRYFALRIERLRALGAKDIILDPGFGFGKTLKHNYELMRNMAELKLFELPLLVGISRKSMVYKLLETTPDEALNGTTVLNTIALMSGANLLRVHDVKACVEAVRIVRQTLL